jgi:hypothetical protein
MTSKPFVASLRFVFSLTVDHVALDRSLGCTPAVINTGNRDLSKTTTIEEALKGNSITFLDPSKKTRKWVVTMRDYMSKVILPPVLSKEVKCHWCHRFFRENPLGCPIRMVNESRQESYYSYSNKRDMLRSTEGEEYYCLVSGLFCAWECVLGFALSVKHLSMYRESVPLTHQLFELSREQTQKDQKSYEEVTLQPAAHFTVLEEYGGPLTRAEYTNQYHRYSKVKGGYVLMVPVGEVYDLRTRLA